MRPLMFFAAPFLALSLVSLAEKVPPPPPAPAATTPLLVFRSIKEQPNAVAFSPDGRFLLSASGFELLLWDVPSAKPLRRLAIPDMFRDITACVFSPDGKTTLAGSNDGKVATWTAETGKLLKVLDSEDWMYDCAFTTDCSHVLSAYQSGHLTFREMATGKVLWEKQSPGVNRCDLSADGKRAITASGSDIEFRDASTGEILRVFHQPGSANYDKTVSLSPDGNLLACPVKDLSSAFVILNTRSGKILRICKDHTNSIRFLGFSPDGSMIASGSTDNTLKLWNSATGKLIRTFSGHNHDVSSAAFLADGSKVLSASKDLSMKLWDCRRETIPPAEHTALLATQALLDAEDRANGYVEPLLTTNPRGYKFGIEDAALSPDGKLTIIWEIASSKAPVIIRNHRDDVNGCAFLPGANSVISFSKDKTVRIFNAADGTPIRTLRAGYEVTSFAVSPDGKRLFTGSAYDPVQTLWDLGRGKPVRIFGLPCQPLGEWVSWFCDITGLSYPFHDYVHCASFSPDGKWLVTGSLNRGIRIRDGATGALVLLVRSRSGHSESVEAVSFSADGRMLLTGSDDGTLKIWDFQQLLDSRRNL